MHWLIIALLVSVGGLLLAAAGMARHVFLHHRRLRHDLPDADAAVVGLPEQSDLESGT
jgi:hypothetical protein